MNSTIKRPVDLFAKIDSVFERAEKVFAEMPVDAIQLARNLGTNKNVTILVNQEKKSGNSIKIK
jgi:hypothetical protein